MNREIQAEILKACARFIRKAFEPVEARVKALEERPPIQITEKAIEGPKGDKGEPGADGQNGRDGLDGKGFTLEDAAPVLKSMGDELAAGLEEKTHAAVKKAIESIPAPKDGVDGKSITIEDILPVLKSMQAEWALDFERRAQALFQKAVDNIPKPKDGRDGIDGIGWDSMRVEHDGRRSFDLIFTKGDQDHSFKVTIPCVIDAGFWKEGMSVEKGDGVTFGGSYWIAQCDTSTKPEIGNPHYRLAVKRGRDGRDLTK